MPAIFAQMRRNTISPCFGRQLGRTHRVRMTPASRIAYGRHVIDVHAQP
jgi:hypothetical protein